MMRPVTGPAAPVGQTAVPGSSDLDGDIGASLTETAVVAFTDVAEADGGQAEEPAASPAASTARQAWQAAQGGEGEAPMRSTSPAPPDGRSSKAGGASTRDEKGLGQTASIATSTQRGDALLLMTTTPSSPLPQRKVRGKAGAMDIWALGVMTIVGGSYASWNVGLSAGYGSMFVAIVVTGAAYVVLTAVLGEMTSAMPFAGGAYAFARVSLGKYAGFLVGCSEAFNYITYAAMTSLIIGSLMTAMLGTAVTLEPLWWCLFLSASTALTIGGGRPFWWLTALLGTVSAVIPLVFFLFSLPGADFMAHARSPALPLFAGGLPRFFAVFPLASWCFCGIEGLTLACDEVREPKKHMHRGLLWCIGTCCLAAVVIALGLSWSAPGVEYYAVAGFPLSNVFSKVVGGPLGLQALWTLPSVLGTGMTFIYFAGRQIFAMSRSGLLPRPLSLTWGGEHDNPHVAMTLAAVLGYLIALLAWLVPSIGEAVYPVCMCMSYAVDLSQLYTFHVLRKHYPNLKREFILQPFGQAAALFSMAVFSLALVSSLFFQANRWLTPGICLAYTLLNSLYYWLYARHQQVISPEEEAVMFVAYVIRSNMKKAEAIRKGQVAPQSPLAAVIKFSPTGNGPGAGWSMSQAPPPTASRKSPQSQHFRTAMEIKQAAAQNKAKQAEQRRHS